MFGSGRKKPSAERTNRRDDPFTALYSKHSKPSTPSTTTGSGSSRSAGRRHRAFLPSSLRRSAQPTVELVTPAPDVELTRASEIVRPVLGMTGELASLQSLRQTQAEHQPAPSDPAASVRSLAASDSDSDGYQDERDIPFRTNAVEIATQDDKGELAFLAHHEPWLGELERSRLILPQLAGRLQPTTHASVLPDRLLAPPEMPSQVYDELEAICNFNQAARKRPGGAMSEFAGEHLRRIVRQLLAEIDVDEAAGWDGVVYDLAVGAVGSVRPDVRHGDNMDLRRYVRIKRIPGGVPGDSQYIAGLVFTKSLAHRRMPRIYSSPRIMLLALPLEHAAPSRYVSFDAELRVQQGFAEKLVQRIVGAGPDVVLAEKPVPRNILEALMRNRVAVVAGVKRSVLRAIARCTGAEIVTSMDKFSGRPRIGTCREMVAQTYQHPSLPQVRKSFVFLDGCEPNRGGTIVLRGESFERLADIKQVVDLAVCFAYSLHLETALLVDEFALAVPGQYNVVS
ncbi:Mitochondrial distribution and morphology protein 12, partial [Linderina pennispora]